ncbi:MAG: GAF and ANTAR domain-containing protein [Nocardioidaceae bacterium]
MTRDTHLVNVMNAVAAALSSPSELDETLVRITHTARDTVPGAHHASITVRHPDGTLETVAPTDPMVCQIDELQYELREGPCFDVVTDDDFILSDDIGAESRWPTYGPRIAALGIRSQLAMRLHLDTKSQIGLNLYSRDPDAFDDPQHVAELFASHAKIALGYAHEVTELTEALATRTVIGKAIGIIMERYTIKDERAFEFLVRLSQTTNTKLRDIAARIVELDEQQTDAETGRGPAPRPLPRSGS